MRKVKICGVTDCSCADVLNELTPDYVGFILTGGYRRSISLNQAKKIRNGLDSRIICVGVFVDEEIDRVVCAVESGAVQAVQLHGGESGEYIAKLKSRVPVTVIKRLKEGQIESCPKSCDFALLDGTARKGAPALSLQPRAYPEIKKPFFIAGGLNPENVASWLKATGAYGADCSGGVESGGAKDGEKIAAFIKNVRRVDNYE